MGPTPSLRRSLSCSIFKRNLPSLKRPKTHLFSMKKPTFPTIRRMLIVRFLDWSQALRWKWWGKWVCRRTWKGCSLTCWRVWWKPLPVVSCYTAGCIVSSNFFRPTTSDKLNFLICRASSRCMASEELTLARGCSRLCSTLTLIGASS